MGHWERTPKRRRDKIIGGTVVLIKAYEPLVSLNKAGYETFISEGGTLG